MKIAVVFQSMSVLLTCVTALSAFAGTDISGGGDGYSSEFIETAKAVLAGSSGRSMVAGAEKLSVAAFQDTLQTTQVESTTEALRDSLGFERDALNIPARKLIRLNRQRWSSLGARQKKVLAIHEYLGILRVDDTAYKISTPIVSAAEQPERARGGGALLSYECFVRKAKGLDPGSQFRVHLFNLAGAETDYRGNPLDTYLVADFWGAGLSISRQTGYSGSDEFGSWSFANIYEQIGADEEIPRYGVRIGGIKTVIGVDGYPVQIRSVFSQTSFALEAKDANNIIRGKGKADKKLRAGFRGRYEDGAQYDADLECELVTDQGRVRSLMFGAIGGVERMLGQRGR